jgi:DNA (cytosine-5)-methyltransferase 1
MRLLDLFCGAGGASMGYFQAGFTDITGVDHRPQPNYPFKFLPMDALEFVRRHGDEFDFIHASPPCQAYIQRNKNLVTKYPKLIDPVRELIKNQPYVIENVEGAPLLNPARLCGTAFGLLVIRHRLFESNIPLVSSSCNHWGSVASGDFAGVYAFGGKGHRHGSGVRDVKNMPGPPWGEAMGIDWMTQLELTQAIPPAYTEYIGKQALDIL